MLLSAHYATQSIQYETLCLNCDPQTLWRKLSHFFVTLSANETRKKCLLSLLPPLSRSDSTFSDELNPALKLTDTLQKLETLLTISVLYESKNVINYYLYLIGKPAQFLLRVPNPFHTRPAATFSSPTAPIITLA